ncbi:FMN-binding protein [Microbacterium flavescens]|jgi:uncharacterized protein with FMN-binding domain|uniref:FMN-binding protein n=1 Tax=Microbacterium flavescens TaxID=69366 RepID=UPI001BDF0349|nr:FMN-binding protein [Microbacterium flavescens]BFF12086.1 hypothetical protein GCM10025699_33890 [Microbacterium flavescens]
MIRPTAPRQTRTIRVATAVVGFAGALTLAGCAGGAGTADGDAGGVDGTDTGSGGAPAYADGTYSAEGAYQTPESVERISVTVTLESDVITDVEVVGDPQKSESEEYQGEFIGGIADVVVGKDIDEISVSRVAGSSLTSGGFNQAIETIKAEAAV